MDSKPHYEILDGLRGVAAIVVILFHLFEAHSQGNHLVQIINHGYLAVDFFFMLSGFVIGYAYDDRWTKMSLSGFFKRRLIRLQPMIVFGSIFGAVLFYFQGASCFPLLDETPVYVLILVMVLGCTILPLPLPFDIRGWGEMHPLNGPAWTLYYEYIGNILYALIFRHLPKAVLAVFVIIAAGATFHLCLSSAQGDIVGGWSLNAEQQYVGFVRLAFPFLGGLLLFRLGKKIKFGGNGFLICSGILVALLAMPRIGGAENLWQNGLYEALCIVCVFPLIVLGGVGSQISGRSLKICKFLGRISYPAYITHYPVVYLYTGWVVRESPTRGMVVLGFLTSFAFALLVAFFAMKFFDEPLRKRLKKRFL